MSKKQCGACQHFIAGEQDQSSGTCTQLSDHDRDHTAGAEGLFFAPKDFRCNYYINKDSYGRQEAREKKTVRRISDIF